MAKTKVNCHLCGTEIERQLAKGIEKYSCADCKLKRSREWANTKKWRWDCPYCFYKVEYRSKDGNVRPSDKTTQKAINDHRQTHI